MLAVALGTGSCTLVKPVVGAVTGPVYAVAGIGGFPHGHHGHDGYGIACFFVAAAAVGATVGLVTGVISDFQYLFGYADDPTRNWANPFATNTSDVSR